MTPRINLTKARKKIKKVIGKRQVTKTKEGGIKTKTKYNKDGTIKKVVTKKGLKRRVAKPKRDSRKSLTNAMRNRRDIKKKRKATTGSARKNIEKGTVPTTKSGGKGYKYKTKYNKDGTMKKHVKIQGGRREKTKRGKNIRHYRGGRNIL